MPIRNVCGDDFEKFFSFKIWESVQNSFIEVLIRIVHATAM